jgi:hypothetical protein
LKSGERIPEGNAGLAGSRPKVSPEFDTGIEKAVREIDKGVEHKKEKGINENQAHGEGVISLGSSLHKVNP